ncbi:MAG TPA: hypothetical protein VNT28_05930 [Candidatus Limnocylindrales bacterium]|nr:hypothetical protein [Candidatus Limnocylindrales bacterium]
MARPELAGLVELGMLDAELAGLLSVLGDHGVPVVVASREPALAGNLSSALAGVSGTLAADSLEEVVRLAGGSAQGGVPDELREMGLVVVARTVDGQPRVAAAHYVRPLERDAGGHVQRRGPAVLAAYDGHNGEWEHFAWAIGAELAERAGMSLRDFEAELDRRRRELGR